MHERYVTFSAFRHKNEVALIKIDIRAKHIFLKYITKWSISFYNATSNKRNVLPRYGAYLRGEGGGRGCVLNYSANADD